MFKDEKIKESFDNLNPTNEQREKMWDEFVNSPKGKSKRSSVWKIVGAVAATVLIFVGINFASGGRVMAAVLEFCGLDGDSQEIIEQVSNIQNNGVEVYAPEIYYMDDETLIFGGLRGLLIYDRIAKGLIATIDVQEIGCIYFNSDSKETGILQKDGSIYVFNVENGAVFGDCYRFDMEQENAVKLAVSQVIEAKDAEEVYTAWAEYQQGYVDTFDGLNDAYFINDDEFDKLGGMYSRRTLCYTDENGAESRSCLLVKGDGEYFIYTSCESEVAEQALCLDNVVKVTEDAKAVINTAENTDDSKLPAFVYSGDDAVTGAVAEYLIEEVSQAYYLPEENSVVVPLVSIHGQEVDGDVTLVFGKFAIYGYTRNGEILECVSGGHMSGCLYVQEVAGELQVVDAIWGMDGSMFEDSIKEMTADYPQYYEGLITGYAEGEQEQLRLEMLRMYVEDNNLEIKYYKDYGWDPVLIKE